MPDARPPRIQKRILAWIGVLFIVLLPRALVAAPTEQFFAKVIGVTDGDTITVLYERAPIKIRLQGIDCPEKRQPFGQQAKQATSSHVFGKRVVVQPRGMDRHGRLIADITFDDTHHLSEDLVREGACWWYRTYAKHDTVLAQLQEDARALHRGLWNDPHPIPPWEWRKPQSAP